MENQEDLKTNEVLDSDIKEEDLPGSYATLKMGVNIFGNTVNDLHLIGAVEYTNNKTKIRVKMVPLSNNPDKKDYYWISLRFVNVIGNPKTKPIVALLYGKI